ncbi:MAG: GxxExxY protein [Anaerolineae bacterium]|nr:GxxExxY protein [Anaerolineae bacterium]
MGTGARGKHHFEPLSHAVLGACIDVQRQMGPHCMEVDYQRALEIALPKHGLQYRREADIPVVYDGVTVTTSESPCRSGHYRWGTA